MNDMDTHAHDLRAGVPDRLPGAVVRELSALDSRRAWLAIGSEWAVVAGAVAAGQRWPWLYPLCVVVIGGRQHAMAILGHDAVHHRLFPDRRWNDWVADLLLLWPIFMSIGSFRFFHSTHHQHLDTPQDGNRMLWNTHDGEGKKTNEWTYPKSRAGLAMKLLRRGAMLTGLWWMVRHVRGVVRFRRSWPQVVARAAHLAVVLGVVAWFDAWSGLFWYWVVPYGTWHVASQYLRLICEHSAMPDAPGAYAQTRTTVVGPLVGWLVLPRNVGFHIEHHWYPSVPWYRLPALHAALMAQPGFREHAVVRGSLGASVAEVSAG